MFHRTRAHARSGRLSLVRLSRFNSSGLRLSQKILKAGPRTADRRYCARHLGNAAAAVVGGREGASTRPTCEKSEGVPAFVGELDDQLGHGEAGGALTREGLDRGYPVACRIGAHRVVQSHYLHQVEELPLIFVGPLDLRSKRAAEIDHQPELTADGTGEGDAARPR
jgi:hypothetical protein